MLGDFQQAFVDLVASPEFCIRVRTDPSVLDSLYLLSSKETERLVAVVSHRGMECNCMLYRANRLAPLAMNLPDLCKALGGRLPQLLTEYWKTHPSPDVNFLVESERFCEFLRSRLELSLVENRLASVAIDRESALVRERMHKAWGSRSNGGFLSRFNSGATDPLDSPRP